MIARHAVRVALGLGIGLAVQACGPALPRRADSTRFAVLGDSGTGSPAQYAVAKQLAAAHAAHALQFVLMLGDNVYGATGDAPDYRRRFERPYRELLAAGVKFYAALGNHDNPNQVRYPRFNMHGRRHYSFLSPNGAVLFVALDTTDMAPEQLGWLRGELRGRRAGWIISFRQPFMVRTFGCDNSSSRCSSSTAWTSC
jgi:hypothetical protein